MRIAICEDDQMHAAKILEMIQRWSAIQEQDIQIMAYESAEAFLKDFVHGAKPDLSFLDIRLGGMSGIELAKRIRQRDMNMQIVFVTSFFDYVLDGYEVSAFRYLIKPVKEKKVWDILNAASETCKKRLASYFTITNEGATYKVAKSDIVYFVTKDHYIYVHTFDGEHRFRGTMALLKDEFSKPAFAKCNRGVVINVEHISSIHKDRVSMVNKETLPLSRKYWEDVNRCFIAVHVDPVAEKLSHPTHK